MIRPLDAEDPRQVGPYELVRRLGRGGMGEVFLGRSPGGRLVAVKVVAAELAHDADFRRRFALEVKAARKVGGFYTAQVVDADTDAVRPWLVTAYIPGPSLHQVVRDSGPLPLRALRVLGSGLAEGLAAIHAADLVHRDLKPANVIVADDGPRVIDFGIARALDGGQHTGAVIGTPGFMSPEQARGESTGPASDVFALGCVLTYAATGHSPYGQGRPDVILYRTVHEPPDLEGVPDELTAFLRICLAPEPGRRPLVSDALQHLVTAADDTQWLPAGVAAMIGERRAATVVLRERATPEPAVTGPGSGPESGPVRRRRAVPVAAAATLAVGAAAWATVALLHPFDAGGGSGTSGSSASAKAAAWSGDPCDVTNYSLIQDHQLTSVGQAGGFTNGSDRVKTCTWKVGAATVDNNQTMTLAYSTAPFHLITDRKNPKESANLHLDGLTSAAAYVNQEEDRCEVDWRTPDGYAAVLESEPRGSASCSRGAQFARDLAPKLAGGTQTT
ncbi:serine/threonine-protein kinase [Streptomyces sp. A1136]|uniref:serine/threonine-protein kinase n=1 Tax=Streptomyces sp. A1136 TaxID=2563102 RepID=UPI00109EB2ED|nr:serine/threonine-protein kinase [Streptomyces sp. A1136]THA47728.1 serine/threonine protein kinase [Streptomyces sp. A1136]